MNFSDKVLVLGEVPAGKTAKTAAEAGEVVLVTYGNFISFLILAFVLFLVINKFMTALKNKLEKPAEAAAPAAPSEDIVLLTEIRDLLKNQKS